MREDSLIMGNGIPIQHLLPKDGLERLRALPHRQYKASLADVVSAQSGAENAWRRKDPVFRWVEKYRTMFWMVLFQRTVLTELQWTNDFMVVEPLERYMSELQALTQSDDIMIPIVTSFVTMKTLERSDTPAWFSLSEDLVYSLLATQLTGVQSDDIKLPLPGFYLEIPPGIMYLENPTTGSHEVRTLAVAEGYLESEAELKTRSIAEGYGVDIPGAPNGFQGRRLLIYATCEPNENSKSVYDDHVFYLSLPLACDKGLSVDDMIKQEDAVLHTINLPKGDELGGHILGVPHTSEEMIRLVRSFVTNFLIYFASPKADVEHKHESHMRKLRKKKRTQKVRAQLDRLQKEPYWVVGSKVVVNAGVRQALQKSGAKGTRKAAYNVLVRGHWRRQWRGKKTPESPKGADWHWVWIEPTVRNFDAAKQIKAHEYQVK